MSNTYIDYYRLFRGPCKWSTSTEYRHVYWACNSEMLRVSWRCSEQGSWQDTCETSERFSTCHQISTSTSVKCVGHLFLQRIRTCAATFCMYYAMIQCNTWYVYIYYGIIYQYHSYCYSYIMLQYIYIYTCFHHTYVIVYIR